MGHFRQGALSFVAAACLSAGATMAGPPDPGLVLSIGGDGTAFSFFAPAGAMFDIVASAGVEVLDSPDGSPIVSGVAPTASFDADDDTDFDLFDLAAMQKCIGAVTPPCDRFDLNVDDLVDPSDWELMAGSLTGPGGQVETAVTLYARGSVASASLGDKSIVVTVGKDEVFSSVATVVGMSVTPTTGITPGSAVEIEIQPFGGPLVIDSGTSASWSGQFQSVLRGSPTDITISYSASDVLETGPNSATIVAGAGLVEPTILMSAGALVGDFALDIGPFQIRSSLDLGLEHGEPNVYKLAFDMENVPSLSSPVTPPLGMLVHQGPVPSDELLRVSRAHHYGVAVKIQKTPATLMLDASFDVNIAGVDLSGPNVVDEAVVTLTRDDGNPDPDWLWYISDLSVPLMPFSVDVSTVGDTVVRSLQVAPDGVVAVARQEVSP